MQTVKTYPCGLRLVHEYMPDRKVATIAFTVMAGSCNDFERKEGIAHLYEHMFFKSTKNRKSEDIALAFDLLGQSNASTSNTMTRYFVTTTCDNAEKVFDILSDCYFNAEFKEDELELEKGVVFSEIQRYEDSHFDVAINELMNVVFNGLPLAHKILGTKESVGSITSEDLRAFRSKLYVAPRMVVTTAGGISSAEIESLVEKYVLKKFQGKAQPETYALPLAPLNIETPFVFTPKETQQMYLSIGIEGINRGHEDFYAYHLFATMLGGGMSSRLYSRIREKEGLVYHISSNIGAFSQHGLVMIFWACDSKNGKKALLSYKDEIQNLIKNGFTAEELERAKTQYITNLLIQDDKVADKTWVNSDHLIFREKSYNKEKLIAQIRGYDIDKINQIARLVLQDSKFAVSVVAQDNNLDVVKLLK